MIDDAEPCDFSTVTERTCRKPRECSDCGRTITPGERYRYCSYKFDGSFHSDSMCQHCYAAASWLSVHCGGFLYGGVLEDLEEHLDDGYGRYAKDSMQLARYVVGIRAQWTRRNGKLMRVPAVTER